MEPSRPISMAAGNVFMRFLPQEDIEMPSIHPNVFGVCWSLTYWPSGLGATSVANGFYRWITAQPGLFHQIQRAKKGTTWVFRFSEVLILPDLKQTKKMHRKPKSADQSEWISECCTSIRKGYFGSECTNSWLSTCKGDLASGRGRREKSQLAGDYT